MAIILPKILEWSRDVSLGQQYQSSKQILLTSGCSFTSSTTQFELPASWPGFVRDRCGFKYAEDWSCPGAGNFFISQSIIEALDAKSDIEQQDCFVIVMWSGIDREEVIDNEYRSTQPRLKSGLYRRLDNSTQTKHDQAANSYNYIKITQQYLEQRKIPYAFTFYINLLEPPLLPSRDTTHAFYDYVSKVQVNDLKTMHILDSQKDCLYDFSFYTDHIKDSDDSYHPTYNCNLEWTDKILLPALAKKELICST